MPVDTQEAQQTRGLLNPAPEQDLHETEAVPPDMSWARFIPMQIQATQERLAKPSQIVHIQNTDRLQTHVIQDRHCTWHEIQAGEIKKNVDMLVEDINFYRRQRNPRPRIDPRTNLVKPSPPHPVVILDVPPEDVPAHIREAFDRIIEDSAAAAAAGQSVPANAAQAGYSPNLRERPADPAEGAGEQEGEDGSETTPSGSRARPRLNRRG